MQTMTEKVKSKDFPEGKEFTCVQFDSLTEASETYGDEAAVSLLNSALKVKVQAIARDGFQNGKDREQVDEEIRNYRPGGTGKQSMRQRALALVRDNAAELNNDPELWDKITEAFTKNQFQQIIQLLEGQREDVA